MCQGRARHWECLIQLIYRRACRRSILRTRFDHLQSESDCLGNEARLNSMALSSIHPDHEAAVSQL